MVSIGKNSLLFWTFVIQDIFSHLCTNLNETHLEQSLVERYWILGLMKDLQKYMPTLSWIKSIVRFIHSNLTSETYLIILNIL